MKIANAAVAGAFLLLLTGSSASADVQLSIRDGRVTLVATNATVRQILTEWARVGQTKIVNVERIPGGPQTLQLTNVPEQEALDLLLRSVTGYMAAQRPVSAANLSRYDRILVLPTAAVARVPVAASPTPVFQPPPGPQRPPDVDNDEGPSIVQPARGPLFPTFQSGPPGNIQRPVVDDDPGDPQTTAPVNVQPFGVSSFPGGATVGTPRPGMVIQPPPAAPGPGVVFPGQPPLPPPEN